jgi:hypothetical protein
MLIETALAQGIIDDAPRLGTALTKVSDFLLSIFGIIAIIGLIVSGLMYLLAGGNQRTLDLAKRSFYYSIVGIILALSAMIAIHLIEGFLV